MYITRFHFYTSHSNTFLLFKNGIEDKLYNTWVDLHTHYSQLGSYNSLNRIEGVHCINRGSYMSAHVLLNLLNELGKRDKMRGLPSILSLFRNEFNKFNNTRARMLDSIYHMTLRLL